MSTRPQISVIIPVFNAGNLLKQSIESLMNQTFFAWEAVCVDDGSTDGSAQVLDCFALQDSRIKVIHKQNGGVSSARNSGLDNAHAPFITMLDADDYLHPQSLEKLYYAMQTHDCDIVCCSMKKIYKDGHVEEDKSPFESGVYDAAPEDIYRFSMRSPCCKLYKKELIENGGIRFPLGVPVCEDDVFVVSYWCHVRRFYMLNEYLYNYVQSNSSVLKKLGKGQLPYVSYRATMDVPILIYRYIESQGGAQIQTWAKILLKSQYHIGLWMLECNSAKEDREKLRECLKANVSTLCEYVPVLASYYIRFRVWGIRTIRRLIRLIKAKKWGTSSKKSCECRGC